MITPTDQERHMYRLVNQLRVNLGLPKYRLSLRLTEEARKHSRTMAAANEIFHPPGEAFPLPADWVAWGQNVGEGSTVKDVEEAFVRSPHHLPQLVDKDFQRIGVGIIKHSDILWVTQNFLARS